MGGGGWYLQWLNRTGRLAPLTLRCAHPPSPDLVSEEHVGVPCFLNRSVMLWLLLVLVFQESVVSGGPPDGLEDTGAGGPRGQHRAQGRGAVLFFFHILLRLGRRVQG